MPARAGTHISTSERSIPMASTTLDAKNTASATNAGTKRKSFRPFPGGPLLTVQGKKRKITGKRNGNGQKKNSNFFKIRTIGAGPNTRKTQDIWVAHTRHVKGHYRGGLGDIVQKVHRTCGRGVSHYGRARRALYKGPRK